MAGADPHLICWHMISTLHQDPPIDPSTAMHTSNKLCTSLTSINWVDSVRLCCICGRPSDCNLVVAMAVSCSFAYTLILSFSTVMVKWLSLSLPCRVPASTIALQHNHEYIC
jgi:hypothetical protein